MPEDLRSIKGVTFGIDQTAIHDGPGVRMNVYVKGCPLRCVWCHSPESQSFRPEVVWYETKCARCRRCIEVCPENVRAFEGVDEDGRARCRLCGECVRACPAGALEIMGRFVSAGEVADEAVRLQPFFRRTGGGVTLTGGEPLAQPAFALAVAKLCRQADIHVAVETCGHVTWGVLSSFLDAVDLFLYDVKLADERRHREQTGAGNRRILANLRRLGEAGAAVIVRVPLVPGVNDDEPAIAAIAHRVAELGLRRIALLPFNPATEGKYSWLGRSSALAGAQPQDADRVRALERILEAEPLEVVEP